MKEKRERVFSENERPFYADINEKIHEAFERKQSEERPVKDLVEELRNVLPYSQEEIDAMSDEARNKLIEEGLKKIAKDGDRLEFMGADGKNHEIEFAKKNGKLEMFMDGAKVQAKQVAQAGVKIGGKALRTGNNIRKNIAGKIEHGMEKAVAEFGR